MDLSQLPDDDSVIKCLREVEEAVQSVAHFKDRTMFVYDEGDLSNKIRGVVKFPAVGIVYEGIRSVDAQKPNSLGSSVELIVSLMVVNKLENTMVATSDGKTPALLYLGQLRRALLDRRSPTGHHWRFLVEAPAKPSQGLTFWIQRWSVPLMLQHNKDKNR